MSERDPGQPRQRTAVGDPGLRGGQRTALNDPVVCQYIVIKAHSAFAQKPSGVGECPAAYITVALAHHLAILRQHSGDNRRQAKSCRL